MNEDIYMMWLDRIDGIGRSKINLLLKYFELPSRIWNSSQEEIAEVIGLDIAKKICNFKKSDKINEFICELEDKNIRYISIFNSEYPNILKEISDPPFGLYIKGDLPKSSYPTLSIVGARRCSEYGASVAFKFAKELAKREVVIISGMARGIDSMAHKGAIAGEGMTIAVLGCGIDICYPAENRELMEKIIEVGCVISEFPPRAPVLAQNFPQRNRIISGLSMGTLVVEAAKKSGTLITVDYALDNGRDVYAVPGNITSALSQGTNELILQGCMVATKYQDILNGMGIIDKYDTIIVNDKKIKSTLAQEEKTVYDCINHEPINIEAITNRLNMPIQTIQYILTFLELSGYIKQLPGQRFIRALN